MLWMSVNYVAKTSMVGLCGKAFQPPPSDFSLRSSNQSRHYKDHVRRRCISETSGLM